MKQKILSALLLFGTVLTISSMAPGCKSKVSDADLKNSAEANLRGNPDHSVVTVNVVDGVATLSGTVKDEATKSSAQSSVSGVKGIKSVNNNITVAAPATPVEVSADDPLRNNVRDAIKDHPGVIADVNDGVITLTGEINKADLSRLMQKLNGLKPKRVENKLTVK